MIRFKKKKSRRPTFITIALLVLLIIFSNRNPQTSRWPSRILNTVLSPINGIFYTISSAAQEAYDSAFGSKATQERVKQLEQENAALEERVRTMEEVIHREDFLRDEYDLLKISGDRLLPALITAKDPSETFVRFTIDKGTKDGVRIGDIVVQGVKNTDGSAVEGLIGRIVEVGLNYSKVMSILDESGNISVVFGQSGDYGIIDRRDEEALYGYSLDPNASVAVGDDVLTSGLGGVYPRGLYIGKVIDTKLSDDELTRRFDVESPVDFSKLYRVLILRNEGKHE